MGDTKDPIPEDRSLDRSWDNISIVVGSVVTLKSGGNQMTVFALSGVSAVCLWMTESGELRREPIEIVTLKVVPSSTT